MVILYAWIIIISLAGLQNYIPFYASLHVRELATLTLLLVTVFKSHSRRYAFLWMLAFLIIFCIFITVFRSNIYEQSASIKLFVRLIMFFSLIIIIPIYIKTERTARNFFMFILVWNSILALSAPLQEISGQILWLSPDNWEWTHGRAGYARFLSILGDPNVGGMIGGLLPLSLLSLRNHIFKSRLQQFSLEIFVLSVSFLLVSYALSLTGLFIFLCSILITWWFSKGHRLKELVQISLIMLIVILLVPDLSRRFVGTFQRFLKPSPQSMLGPSLLPRTNALMANLDFRLFGYLDVNDTAGKVLFGSTYNIVVPSSYFNSHAILAHNGYKEMYLAGGLLQLGLYLTLFTVTGVKGYRLVRYRKALSRVLVGPALGSVFAFFILLGMMTTFPIYHYNGIGIVFWSVAGLIHVISDRLAIYPRQLKYSNGL